MKILISNSIVIIFLTSCAFGKTLEYIGDNDIFHNYEGNCFLIADKKDERLIVQKCPLRAITEVVGDVATLGIANPGKFSIEKYNNAIEDYLTKTYINKKCKFESSISYDSELHEYNYSCE
tara:strand:+ start:114 stop:476 length:363 start_codon:yes stop_codon:yes gene_type:complete